MNKEIFTAPTVNERMMTKMAMRKACPLLVQVDTNLSCTVSGQSWTRTYFLECIGERRAAYRAGYGCLKFDDNPVDLKGEKRMHELL